VGYQAQQIGDALKDAYAAGATTVARILRDIGFAVNAIIGTLQSVFNAGLGFIANILDFLGFDICKIGIFDFLCDIFDLEPNPGRGTGR